MYRIKIKTKYNTIILEREDYNTPEMKEIFDQPYIEEIKILDLDAKPMENRENDAEVGPERCEDIEKVPLKRCKTRKLVKDIGVSNEEKSK